jgi:hypothetical protein
MSQELSSFTEYNSHEGPMGTAIRWLSKYTALRWGQPMPEVVSNSMKPEGELKSLEQGPDAVQEVTVLPIQFL